MLTTRNRLLLFFCALALIILFGLRAPSNGRDIMTYYNVLNDLSTWLPRDYEREISNNLFYKILRLVGARSLSLQGFIFVMTASIISWCTFLVYRSKLDVGMAYIMFFCSTLFAFQLSGFRFFIAFLLVLTAVERSRKGRIAFFGLAILVHPIISVFVVIYFYYKIKITRRVALVLVLMIVICWDFLIRSFESLYDVVGIVKFYGYNDFSGAIGLFPYLVLTNMIAYNRKTLILSAILTPALALPGSHRIFWFLPLFVSTLFYEERQGYYLRTLVIQGALVVLFMYYLFSIYGISSNEIIPLKYENSSSVHL